MSAYDSQFLPPDKVIAEALAKAVAKAVAVGVDTGSIHAMRKAHSRPLRLDDALLKRGFVEQVSFDATVATIRKLHQSAGRVETGDTMTELRKAVRLPPQSDNAENTTAPPGRAGGIASSTSGYQNGPSDDAKPPLLSGTAPHSASVSRPSRSMVDAPLRAEPTADEDDSDKAGPLDVTVKAIRAEHRKGPRRGW